MSSYPKLSGEIYDHRVMNPCSPLSTLRPHSVKIVINEHCHNLHDRFENIGIPFRVHISLPYRENMTFSNVSTFAPRIFNVFAFYYPSPYSDRLPPPARSMCPLVSVFCPITFYPSRCPRFLKIVPAIFRKLRRLRTYLIV
jgi:hypothetical protein